MNTIEWDPRDWLPIVLSLVVAIGMPIVTCVKHGTPAPLRERIRYSRRGAVVVQTVAICVSACAVGLLLALGGIRFPVLWGAALVAISAMSSSLWYAVRYHRMRRLMESELEAGLTPDQLGQP